MRILPTLYAIMLASFAAGTPSVATAKDFTGCKTGTKAQTIAIAKDFDKACHNGDAGLLGKTLATDFVSEPVASGELTVSAATIRRMKFVPATFRPKHIDSLDFIVEGNKVAPSLITPTHRGSFYDVAPNGKKLKFGDIGIHTVCNCKIVLGHHEEGWMAVMSQLGVLPVKK